MGSKSPPEPTRPHVGRRIVHVLPPLLAQPVVARIAALAPQAAVRRLGNHLGYVWGYVMLFMDVYGGYDNYIVTSL